MEKVCTCGLAIVAIILSAAQLGNGISVEEDLTITFSEKQAMDELRKRVLSDLPHEYMKQDVYLIRWVRARNLNVDSAELMLRNNLKWREANNMDTINEEDWSDMKEDFPYWTDAFDKKGRPVGTLNIQGWNFRRIAVAGKMPRLIRYMDKLLEEATQGVIAEQQKGNNVTQWKVILNMDGFNLIQHGCPICIPAYAVFVNSYEEHYPGYADGLILINTPSTFRIVLEVVRPFFTAPTQRALKIFSTDKTKWGEFLDEEIDKSQRRPEFGGTKTEGKS